ncbi:MAG: serine/threonine-protein phosphatase [Spirochaetia bacterium]|nr:serine/threonine-protein phosphatase [Spirochaetia bacterium]
MIYIILNLVVVAGLVYFTQLLDRKVKTDSFEVTAFAISLLFAVAEAVTLVIVLFLYEKMSDILTTQLLRIVFCLDGMMFTCITFGFASLAANTKKFLPKLLQIAICIAVVPLIYTKFSQIQVTMDRGIIIQSEYLFGSDARNFFPWTWVTVYTIIYRYILPMTGLLFMAIKTEEKASQLEKSQAVTFFGSIVLMWACSFIINFISKVIPPFSTLYMYAYLFMYVVIYMALTQTTVPTGRGFFFSILKMIASYFIPAAFIGFTVMFTQPLRNNFDAGFIVFMTFVVICAVVYSYWISALFARSTRFYTADYENSLERDLASIDYATGEMDYIASRMFEIVKRNTDAGSMNVYILNSQNELEVAYSSNGMTEKVSVNTPGFEYLLNINRSIVLQSQLEKVHDLAECREQIQAFFDKYKSDALFILNEGHNIFGVITLGKKINGDHYKEYDYNVFDKLYSHFFVYGYYMRNISNKDLIGVVNREIRMSSQIITSIQENIDHVKNDKIDTGYLMVPAHNIGGEFIDMIRLTATRHLFVVGDLSGKGIAASMNMVILKSIIRTFLADTHDFKELVIKTNTFIRDSLRKGTIFAGLFALVDFETDTMYYINCGIPALMMYTQVYNNVIEIQGSGHVLGFVKDISPYISVKTTKLNRGDIILACTDGLVQSHSLRGEMYGKERIQQAILDNSTYNAQRMTQFTFDDLMKFMSKEMEDDVSILVLKYESKVAEEEFADVAESEQVKEVPEEIVVPDYVDANLSEVIEEPVYSGKDDYAIDLPESIDGDEFKIPVDNFSDEELPGESKAEELSVEDLPTSIADSEAPLPSEPDLEESNFSDSAAINENSEPEAAQPEPEAPVAAAVTEAMPADPDLPDLSDLDAMLKEAGL